MAGGHDRVAAEAAAKAEAEALEAARAADPDWADRERLTQAFQGGQHYPVLEEWMAEGGARQEARRKLARKIVGKPSKKLQKKKPELASWLKGR